MNDTDVTAPMSLLPIDVGLETLAPTTDKPRIYPLPILASSTFFPAIDYSTAFSSLNSGLIFSPEGPDIDDDVNLCERIAQLPLGAAPETFGRDKFPGRSHAILHSTDSHTNSTAMETWIRSTAPRSLSAAADSICTQEATSDTYYSSWDKEIPPVARNISMEDIVAAGIQVLLFGQPSQARKQKQAQYSSFPSPYLNTLDISRTRTLAACIHNARSMGFTEGNVIKPFCIAPSLFYRHHSPGDDKLALLASVSDPSIPSHLRPTLPQVLYPHPAFIDLIPLPEFRNRVILSAAKRGWEEVGKMGQGLFELKKDIFEDGLSCRSAEHGEDAQRTQPWDMRSWRASTWFTKKWSGLMNDECVSTSA